MTSVTSITASLPWHASPLHCVLHSPVSQNPLCGSQLSSAAQWHVLLHQPPNFPSGQAEKIKCHKLWTILTRKLIISPPFFCVFLGIIIVSSHINIHDTYSLKIGVFAHIIHWLTSKTSDDLFLQYGLTFVTIIQEIIEIKTRNNKIWTVRTTVLTLWNSLKDHLRNLNSQLNNMQKNKQTNTQNKTKTRTKKIINFILWLVSSLGGILVKFCVIVSSYSYALYITFFQEKDQLGPYWPFNHFPL